MRDVCDRCYLDTGSDVCLSCGSSDVTWIDQFICEDNGFHEDGQCQACMDEFLGDEV